MGGFKQTQWQRSSQLSQMMFFSSSLIRQITQGFWSRIQFMGLLPPDIYRVSSHFRVQYFPHLLIPTLAQSFHRPLFRGIIIFPINQRLFYQDSKFGAILSKARFSLFSQLILIITMGLPLSKGQRCLEEYESTVEFITERESEFFGKIRIYKMREKPYEYLFRKTYRSLEDDDTIREKYDWLSCLKEDKNIVGIEFIHLSQQTNACGTTNELNFFSKYYCFTLQDAIENNTRKKVLYAKEEVAYMAQTLFYLYDVLHEKNPHKYLGLFKSQILFISPQGLIKIYPMLDAWIEQFMIENEMESQGLSFCHQKEVCVGLKEKSEIRLENISKTCHSDLKDIGVVLLEMLTLGKSDDFRFQNGEPKEEIVELFLKKPEDQPLGPFKNLLRGIFEYSWSIDELKRQLHTLIKNNIFFKTSSLKLSQPEGTAEKWEIKQQIWLEIKKGRSSHRRRSSLIPGKVASGIKRVSKF